MAIADRPNNNDEASRNKAFIYIYLFEPLFNGDGPRIKQRWGLEQGTVQSDDGTRHPKHRLAKLGVIMGVK
jgi:hypothetical protein